MEQSFTKSLERLSSTTVDVSIGNRFPEPKQAPIALRFSDGTVLHAEFWRIVQAGKVGSSSFDHRQAYGMPTPIDAVEELTELLRGKQVFAVSLEPDTGDLTLLFAGEINLRIFNFTSYEIWEMRFADGTGEYSNHVK